MWPRWGYKFIHHLRHPLHHSDVSGRLWPSSSLAATPRRFAATRSSIKTALQGAPAGSDITRLCVQAQARSLTWLPSSGKCESELRPAGLFRLQLPSKSGSSESGSASLAILAHFWLSSTHHLGWGSEVTPNQSIREKCQTHTVEILEAASNATPPMQLYC
jgi:hypothetical protein